MTLIFFFWGGGGGEEVRWKTVRTYGKILATPLVYSVIADFFPPVLLLSSFCYAKLLSSFITKCTNSLSVNRRKELSTSKICIPSRMNTLRNIK